MTKVTQDVDRCERRHSAESASGNVEKLDDRIRKAREFVERGQELLARESRGITWRVLRHFFASNSPPIGQTLAGYAPHNSGTPLLIFDPARANVGSGT